MQFVHAACSAVGPVRDHNEDSHLADPDLGLYVVADGMGGRAAGEVASRLAVESVRAHVTERRDRIRAFVVGAPDAPSEEIVRLLSDAILAAARAVFAASLESAERRGMGTTLTVLLLAGDRGFVAHVGDSRAYMVRGGRCTQLTRDHSLVDELVVSGQLTREEAASPELERLRNVLARAVGVANDVQVDALQFETLPGDRYLLCSDGLTHYVEPEEMASVLANDVGGAVDQLVQAACDRGGHDNVTAVAVECRSTDGHDAERSRRHEITATALASVPLFRNLDPHEIEHVILAAERLDAPEGRVLLREDQPIPALFVVLSGRVDLARAGTSLGQAGSGTCFGDAALVDRWISAPTAVAAEPTRLVRLTRDALVAVSRREPEIAAKIVATFARDAADRSRPAPKA